jgi:endoglucanase
VRCAAAGATWVRLARLATLAALVIAALGAVAAPGHGAPRPVQARAAHAQRCADRFPARRDPANPLDLPAAPGQDPLTGARFFVPGPAHGAAAGAMARLLGLDPGRMSDRLSWTRFAQRIVSGRLARAARRRDVVRAVRALARIASQPEAQRISIYSEGGGPGAISGQTEKILCQNMRADPHSIPIFDTDFLHAELGYCPSAARVIAYDAAFHRQIDELARAIARRPAVVLLEIDAIGSSRCIWQSGSLPEWEADLRFEIDRIGSLPHTAVYVEAGYSDANSPAYTAAILNAVGVARIRGFFTNDTHENWTIDEVRWAQRISRLTGGAHFIVNTADNGQGPLRNAHPARFGTNDLCNAPGRGLGPLGTTATGFAHADAFVWTHPPGNSSGRCNGGPSGGVFWPARAIALAERANQRLGPGWPSRPY